jgi:hypothetical protein
MSNVRLNSNAVQQLGAQVVQQITPGVQSALDMIFRRRGNKTVDQIERELRSSVGPVFNDTKQFRDWATKIVAGEQIRLVPGQH